MELPVYDFLETGQVAKKFHRMQVKALYPICLSTPKGVAML